MAEERLGGRDGASSGAAGDFHTATNIALRMATEYGMGSALGRLSLGAGGVGDLPPEWQRRVLAEVTTQLAAAYERCKAVIEANEGAFEKIASELLVRGTLSREDLERLVGGKSEGAVRTREWRNGLCK